MVLTTVVIAGLFVVHASAVVPFPPLLVPFFASFLAGMRVAGARELP